MASVSLRNVTVNQDRDITFLTEILLRIYTYKFVQVEKEPGDLLSRPIICGHSRDLSLSLSLSLSSSLTRMLFTVSLGRFLLLTSRSIDII